MSLRIAQVHTSPARSPFLDAQAANAAWLAAALGGLGHDVDVFRAPPAARDLRAYDVVHVHGNAGLGEMSAPVVRTQYGIDPAGDLEVALSWRQAARLGRCAGVITPALDTAQVPDRASDGESLAFAFGGSDEYALSAAISIASATERPLDVIVCAGAQIAPGATARLAAAQRQGVRLVRVGPGESPAALAGAAACLALDRVPFDMAALTAMAAGVPVVALESSPAAEVIVSGESGWVCAGTEDAARAIDRLHLLRPALGRSRARLLFDAEAVAARYQSLYFELLSGGLAAFRHPEEPEPEGRTLPEAVAVA